MEQLEKKNLTAVEWLNNELNKINFQATQDEHYTIDRLFEWAKQMEKEQLNIARLDGINLANKK